MVSKIKTKRELSLLLGPPKGTPDFGKPPHVGGSAMKREAWFRHPRLNDVVAEMWGGSVGGSQNFLWLYI